MATVAEKIPVKTDARFGDFLSPIFVKELRQGLRANQFVWPFIVVQIAAIACIATEFVAVHLLENSNGFTQALFYGFLAVVFLGILPLTLFGALQPELSSGRNIELLLMSNLTRWQIVLGKWGVGSVLSALMLVSLLPYGMFRYMIGNISDFTFETFVVLSLILGNAIANAIVIGASGFRNYVGRVFMILLSLGFSIGSFAAIVVAGNSLTLAPFSYLFKGIIAGALLIALNLQLGRAKLRLYENPLDPPSSALIVVLIICTPIICGISRGLTFTLGDWGGWLMAIGITVLTLLIDPGPGKKNRKWAQA